jgi:hypothetical protein
LECKNSDRLFLFCPAFLRRWRTRKSLVCQVVRHFGKNRGAKNKGVFLLFVRPKKIESEHLRSK